MPTTLDTTKDSKGNLCYIITEGTDEILVDVDDYNEAKQLNISRIKIIYHARKGRQHFKRFIRNVERKDGIYKLKQKERESKERRMKMEEAKKRKEQERLAMIEAYRRRDPYWFDITWQQMFKGWS
ncbi:SA1788 family PVL leukocidin-associated protein [Staphylococcus kloosii]|jgi:hypothetical protein|uniref:SA1788 family PVL leukocidin-associated protein n=1 Tax=Staphylococcus kloosii TaxID=29384 RepID=UPI0018A035B2|nr:SA1788 family PVL leukocidin-associated protein [Staphylococcus kloosii]MBF7028906.1 hypothetical protein [Staphylococcus kloosii]